MTGKRASTCNAVLRMFCPSQWGDFDQTLLIRGVPCWAEKVWFDRWLDAACRDCGLGYECAVDPKVRQGKLSGRYIPAADPSKESTKWHSCTVAHLCPRGVCVHTLFCNLLFPSVFFGYSFRAAHRSVSSFGPFHSFPLWKCSIIKFSDSFSQIFGLFSFFLNINNSIIVFFKIDNFCVQTHIYKHTMYKTKFQK